MKRPVVEFKRNRLVWNKEALEEQQAEITEEEREALEGDRNGTRSSK